MMNKLTKKELAALAMHELMKREQEHYSQRALEQKRIANLSEKELKSIVESWVLITEGEQNGK